jgi:hypothetical protein
MRSKVVRTLALALLLGGVGFVLGQTPQQSRSVEGESKQPPKRKVIRVEEEEETPKQVGPKAPQQKSKLEEMLAEALKNNPDIRVASAKLAEADAELNRTRLQVTQKVVMLYHAIETQKKVVENAEKRDKRAQNLGASISSEELDVIRQSLTLAKAKLAELEAQLPALLGKGRSSAGAGEAQLKGVRQIALNALNFEYELAVPEGKLFVFEAKANIPQAEKIRKALQTPVKVDYKDMTFDAILKDLSKKVPGLAFRNVAPWDRLSKDKMNLSFEEALPVSAILQALADDTGCYFFVREYGIVATGGNNQPPGAMTVEQFLRQKPAEKSGNQPAGAKNPPAENVEGRVKAIDASGLMTISIGSDAGLAKGHTLELFRLAEKSSESRYLGTIRILETQPHQSVAQPVGRLTAPPQLGDRVASRIAER